MRKMTSLKNCLAIAVMMAMGAVAHAQQPQQRPAGTDMLYAPLIYDNGSARHAETAAPSGPYSLDAGDQWLQEAMANAHGLSASAR